MDFRPLGRRVDRARYQIGLAGEERDVGCGEGRTPRRRSGIPSPVAPVERCLVY